MVASANSLSASQCDYYLSLTSEGGDDGYFGSGMEPAGYWLGSGTSELGLWARVQAADLRQLFLGFGLDGNALVRNAGADDRRAAVDLTLSAPKSVSCLFGISDASVRHQVEQAHRAAVEAALRYFEENFAFCRFGKAGEERVKAQIIAAVFEHGSARAAKANVPAPQLHSHALIANIGITADGRTSALDTSAIFYQKMLLGAYYRCELGHQLQQRLGLALDRQRTWFEVKDVPRQVCEHFSARRKEILEHLDAKGFATAQAAAVAALETRQAKEQLPRHELMAKWREAAAELGFGQEQVDRLIGRNQQRNPAHELNEALDAAVKRLTAGQSHFTQAELLRATLEESQGRGLSSNRVENEVRAALEQSPELVRLGRRGEELRYTSQEMLRIEERMLANAERLHARSSIGIDFRTVAEVLNAQPLLNDEQRKAIVRVTTGTDLEIVVGWAGTGKSTMLHAAREVWEREGMNVIGATLSGKAAEGLEQSAGIKSHTIAKLFGSEELGHVGDFEKASPNNARRRAAPTLDRNSVLVIDEAGMVGTRQMEKIVAACERAGARLVLVGDPGQLQAIEAGGPMKSLAERYGCAELTTIVRQRDEWARNAVKDLAVGDAGTALRRYAERGLLHIERDRHAAIESLVSAYVKDGLEAKQIQGKLAFAATNLEAGIINNEIQRERLAAGMLGRGIEVGSGHLHEGDRILFTRNSGPLGVKNGTLGTVESINLWDRVLSVKLDGDDRHDLVHVPLETYDHVRSAYAITVHRGQGITLERDAYVLAGGGMTDRHLAYVQCSRAKQNTHVFCDRLEAGEELERLAKSMSRDRSKDLAVDIPRQPERAPEPCHEHGHQLTR